MTELADSEAVEYRFGSYSLTPRRRILAAGGEPVRLGSRAMDILIALVEQAGEVVSKDHLMRQVWPHSVVEEGSLRVHVAALRKALGEGRSGARFIANIPMRGYCFVAPVTFVRAGARLTAAAPAAHVEEPSALPPPLTRIIGRDEAIGALVAAASEHRLVTLVGPGGMGKTTVALAAAEQLRSLYPEGVHFVDLGALADGGLISSATATALGIPLRTEDVERDVAAWLSRRKVLLVLDNCEHLVGDAASFVEPLLAGAPHVHVLATSREPLRARGEWVQRLASLTMPPADEVLSYEQALAYPAFELFVERASASLDGISFNDASVPAISAVCRRLDGMPLAIELVAAQVGFFGLKGLLEKLEDHLALPTLGHRTALPRHQTLRATMEWSYQLLAPAEQRVLRRLSVFRERFSLAAADKVAGDTEEGVAHAVMGLVSKSLIAADASEETVQYRLLETTRSFAREMLATEEEHARISRSHCMYCLDSVALAAADIDVLEPARWRERHGRKVDDIRAALSWAYGPAGDFRLGARLVAESPALWFGLWLVKEYLSRLSQTIALLPAEAKNSKLDMQLSVEFAQATIAMKGGVPEAMDSLGHCIDIARSLGAPAYELRALWARFGAHLLRGEYTAALQDTEAYGLAQENAGDPRAQFIFHRMKALCLHFLGDQVGAREHAELSLDPQADGVRYANGNGYQFEHRPAALTHLARVLWLRGEPEAAAAAAQAAVDAAKALDHPLSLAYALSYGACPIAIWSGNDMAASCYVGELQECTQEHGLVYWQSWPRVYRTALAKRAGLPQQADMDPGALPAGQLDMLATLHADFVLPGVARRAQANLIPWCLPEIWRVQAVQQAAAGETTAAAKALLVKSVALAREQGALAWELRALTSLAQLPGETDVPEVLSELARAVAQFKGSQETDDVRCAKALLRSARAENDVAR